MSSDSPAYKTAIHLTRHKNSKLKWKEAMWYKNYFPDGMHGVRFIGTVDIKRGNLYEIKKKGQED